MYVTKEQFDSVQLPAESRRFVIIRDLRDTLVSAYFSIKLSHALIDYRIARWRLALESLNLEDGMIYLMDERLPYCSRIQESWVRTGERVIKYEDLPDYDFEVLHRVFLEECHLEISPDRLKEIVLCNRFERLTGNRKRGEEEVAAHERKGVAGDWRNHFGGKVREAFKNRYGPLLVATGYEQGSDW